MAARFEHCLWTPDVLPEKGSPVLAIIPFPFGVDKDQLGPQGEVIARQTIKCIINYRPQYLFCMGGYIASGCNKPEARLMEEFMRTTLYRYGLVCPHEFYEERTKDTWQQALQVKQWIATLEQKQHLPNMRLIVVAQELHLKRAVWSIQQTTGIFPYRVNASATQWTNSKWSLGNRNRFGWRELITFRLYQAGLAPSLSLFSR